MLLIFGYSTLDVRLRAVKAVVDNGLSVTDVAFAYGTTRSTIHRWMVRFSVEGGYWAEASAGPWLTSGTVTVQEITNGLIVNLD